MDILCPTFAHIACFGCRAKCKGPNSCAQGAQVNQCAVCSTLFEEQWSHLRENFAKRSAYSNHSGSQDESNVEPETEDEPVDDRLLDLEPEQPGNIAPVTDISPIANQPSSAYIPVMSFPAHTTPVLQSFASAALFRVLDPVLSAQDTIPTGKISNRQYMPDKMTTFSLPQSTTSAPKKAGRLPSIKLPMVAELSHLQRCPG